MGGANKPHSIARVDAVGVAKAYARTMAAGLPESLTPPEIGLDREPLTRPPTPIPIFAWVHYGTVPVRVAGYATAWTPDATALKWTTPEGVEHKAWVWTNATAPRRDIERGPLSTATDIGIRSNEQAARDG